MNPVPKVKAFTVIALVIICACAELCAPGKVWGQQAVDPHGATPAVTAASLAEAKESFARGQRALAAGDLDTAEKEFRKVLAIDPRSGAAYANLGVVSMRRKNWQQALVRLEKAEKLEPTMTGVRLNIGILKYRAGDYAGAIVPLESVIREQPDSGQARYLLGLCKLFTEHYADAVEVLEPLWAQQSNNFMYLYVLGIAAHSAGRKELDEKALARLVEVGGESPEFHLILGKAYLNREEPEKAMAELQRAAAANDRLPYLHYSLGMAYLRLDKNAEAEAEFRKDLEVEPDLPETYEQLGEFYMRAGNNQEALKFYLEALKRNAKMASALFGAAKIHSQQEQYQVALKEIDLAVQLAPGERMVHYLRGQILGRLGRKEEAQAEFATSSKILNEGLQKRRETLGDTRTRNPELAQPPQQ